MATVTEIRLRQFGFKPNELGTAAKGTRVEFISFPFPERGHYYIMARTIVGDPTSMQQFQIPDWIVDLINMTEDFTQPRRHGRWQ